MASILQVARETPPPAKYSSAYDDEASADDLEYDGLDAEPLDEENGEPLDQESDGSLEENEESLDEEGDKSPDEENEKPLDAHMVYAMRGGHVAKPTQELKPFDRPSQAHRLGEIMRHANVEPRNTIHVHPRTLPDRPIHQTVRGREMINNDSLSIFLHKHRAAVIGGAIVRDISLLVGGGPPSNGKGQAKVQFADLPVVPFQAPESSGIRSQLLSSSNPVNSKHLLVFPEEYIAPPGFERVKTLPLDALEALRNSVSEAPHEVETTFLDVYTVSGDIVDFWGIKGLTAKLYKHKSKTIV